MEFFFKIDEKMVTIKLIRKLRTKNTYLRVKNQSLIEISTNLFFTKKDANYLLENKKEWLVKNLKKYENSALKENEFYFLGVKHKNLDNRNLDVFYKDEAKKIIPPLVEKYSDIMNLQPTNIKFRKNKRTWGSCNYKNGLNFNTLLVKFPIEIVEYVVIHELAHIEHKNHSKEFYSLVKKYCHDYKEREKLFKSLL